jgi:hypothetical protein
MMSIFPIRKDTCCRQKIFKSKCALTKMNIVSVLFFIEQEWKIPY